MTRSHNLLYINLTEPCKPIDILFRTQLDDHSGLDASIRGQLRLLSPHPAALRRVYVLPGRAQVRVVYQWLSYSNQYFLNLIRSGWPRRSARLRSPWWWEEKTRRTMRTLRKSTVRRFQYLSYQISLAKNIAFRKSGPQRREERCSGESQDGTQGRGEKSQEKLNQIKSSTAFSLFLVVGHEQGRQSYSITHLLSIVACDLMWYDFQAFPTLFVDWIKSEQIIVSFCICSILVTFTLCAQFLKNNRHKRLSSHASHHQNLHYV